MNERPPMTCVCGHPESAHTFTGRCRVPGCPCEAFEPMPQIADSPAAGAREGGTS